jgi:ATP-dependent RNA helicase DeaD
MSEQRKDVLGKIDLREMNSWVEVDTRVAGKFINAIDGKNFKGRRIRMNDANSGGRGGSR